MEAVSPGPEDDPEHQQLFPEHQQPSLADNLNLEHPMRAENSSNFKKVCVIAALVGLLVVSTAGGIYWILKLHNGKGQTQSTTITKSSAEEKIIPKVKNPVAQVDQYNNIEHSEHSNGGNTLNLSQTANAKNDIIGKTPPTLQLEDPTNVGSAITTNSTATTLSTDTESILSNTTKSTSLNTTIVSANRTAAGVAASAGPPTVDSYKPLDLEL